MFHVVLEHTFMWSCSDKKKQCCFLVFFSGEKEKVFLFLSFGKHSEGLLVPGAEHLWRHKLGVYFSRY